MTTHLLIFGDGHAVCVPDCIVMSCRPWWWAQWCWELNEKGRDR